MTERPAAGSRVPLAVAALLASALVAGLAGLVLYPDAGHAPHRWIKTLDHAVMGGVLHRALTGDPVTRPSALDVPPARTGAYAWLDENEDTGDNDDGGFLAIAHGLGPSLETGRNTLETFRAGVEAGFTIFEVDLVLTADSVLACYHDRAGEDPDPLTWAVVRQRAPDACRFETLLDSLASRPDAFLVLDVKNRFQDAYDRIGAMAAERGVVDRLIPQLYHFSQLRRFREPDPDPARSSPGNPTPEFAGALFTAYRSALSTRQVLEFALEAGVEVVTLPVARVEEWTGPLPTEPRILTHPVNDPFLAQRLRARGVDGIYTSYLAPATVPALYR